MLLDVNDSEFENRLARLLENLDQAAKVLRDHGEDRWLGWVTRCRRELEAYDAAALDHVLGAYGGMGSFNDLLLLSMNGHVVGDGEESAVNERLHTLRTAIWEDAIALRHDLGPSS